MNIDDVKTVLDRIVAKKDNAKRLTDLKAYIDNRTDPTGVVKITIEDKSFDVDPSDLKKILDKKILGEDTTADEAELKQKVK